MRFSSGASKSVAWSGSGRRAATLFGAATLAVVIALVMPSGSATAADPVKMVKVIVTGSSTTSADSATSSNGGEVDASLALVNSVAATVPEDKVNAIDAVPGTSISIDTKVAFEQVATTTSSSPVSTFVESTGAKVLRNGGIDGRGVTVAVLDTGINAVDDLAGRVIAGVDFSSEKLPLKDSFGHGTFIAGLIAGNGSASGGQYAGIAPGANVVSVKVAGADGATSSSTVISGIEWSIRNRDRLGIKVLNLSLGTDPSQSTTTSPLNAAVERAWAAGITVVASAGNSGPMNGTITKPGDDPLVITVGATDEAFTAARSDDTVTTFSSVGPTRADGWYKPDLVAPGRTLVSLRAVDSTNDLANPAARIATSYFKGSGTSFSAAVTSGAAALMLQSDPTSTPDSIKGRMLMTAAIGPVGDPFVDGHGALAVDHAATATGIVFNQANAVRAGGRSPTVNGVTDLGSAWNGSAWNGSAWNGSAWNGSAWNGSAWNGSAWNGSAWNGSAWNGSAWNGSAWNGSAWNGSAWNGSAWN